MNKGKYRRRGVLYPVRQTMTESMARAAAEDAAFRHMRAAGRSAWNADDYAVAVEEFNNLWPEVVQ